MPFLFINPPVEDFSCSNYFHAPFGMLRVLAACRTKGLPCYVYDFLHEDFARQGEIFRKKKNGLIEYPQVDCRPPAHLQALARRYRLFGNNLESFEAVLREMSLKPTDIRLLVNTEFTYRADGLIRFLRNISRRYGIPFTRMMLGGVASMLIPEYFLYHLPGITIYSPDALRRFTGREINIGNGIPPALDVYTKLHFIPFRISALCPFNCQYCAAAFLYKTSFPQTTSSVFPSGSIGEAERLGNYVSNYAKRFGTQVLAPLDDALMFNLAALKTAITGKKFKIFTPNGLHLTKITHDTASLLFKLGFQELRFGVESTSAGLQPLSDHKMRHVNIREKTNLLIDAGFNANQIRFYVFYGLPGQRYEEALNTLDALKRLGFRFNLSGYSPVPHTALFRKINKQLGGLFDRHPDLANNNTVALWNPEFTPERIDALKRACQMV